MTRRLLELTDGLWVKFAFDPRPRAGADSSVREYTTFSARRQTAAKSRITGGGSAPLGIFSQATIVSYIRRP